MLQFSSNPLSVHTQGGKESIYASQELPVTSPLNPVHITHMGIFQKTQVASKKQKYLVHLYLKIEKGTSSSDHERENWIILIDYSHIFVSQSKLAWNTFHKFTTVKQQTSAERSLPTYIVGVSKSNSQNVFFTEGHWWRFSNGEVICYLR